ncbi:MAG: hypothetical protein NT154_12800 [Verrucomicrobia bacterium]|nr:hypothetical protein [Verrucomicrobiota bacterium]
MVATYNKAANTMKYYINALLIGTDTAANFTMMKNANTPIQIGAWAGYDWPGNVDEVAWYNTTLSSDRIVAHYSIGKYGNVVPLTLTTLPQSQSVVVGSPAQFTVEAGGLPPFSYQWTFNSVAIPRATNNSYTIPSAYFTDAGNYSVTVTCTSGTTNSPAAVLTVIPQPSYAEVTNGLLVHLTFDGDYNDHSGQGNNAAPQGTPDFVRGIVGSQALQYSSAAAASAFNYVSLMDTNSMTLWPALAFGSGPWSTAYWVKLTNGANYLPFLANNNGGVAANNSSGFAFGSDLASGGELRLTYRTQGFSWILTNGVSIADGNWHHIAVVSGPFLLSTYIDGQPAYDASGSGSRQELRAQPRPGGPCQAQPPAGGDQPRPELASGHAALLDQRGDRLYPGSGCHCALLPHHSHGNCEVLPRAAVTDSVWFGSFGMVAGGREWFSRPPFSVIVGSVN